MGVPVVTRAYDSDVLLDEAGNCLVNALGTLYSDSTATTLVTDNYTAEIGGTLSNTVTTDALGRWTVHMTTPKSYWVRWADNSNAAYAANRPTVPLFWTTFTSSEHQAREKVADESSDDTRLTTVEAGLAQEITDRQDGDALAVHLAGSETITGSKQFTALWFDNTGGTGPTDDEPFFLKYSTHGDPATRFREIATSIAISNGDNTNFYGTSTHAFYFIDHPTVDASTKGVGYALQSIVKPIIDRDNVPFDDVVSLILGNQGTGRATDCVYVEHNRADKISNPTADDWLTIFTSDAWAEYFMRANGHHRIGLDFTSATLSGAGAAALRLANSQRISQKNAAGTVTEIVKLDAADILTLYDNRLRILDSGSILLNNDKKLLGRNAADSASVEMIKVDVNNLVALGTDKVLINPTTGNVSIITNNAGLFGRTAAAASIEMIRVNASDQVEIGALGTPTVLQATVAASASVRLPHGTAPTSPVNGDVWTSTAGLFTQINGTTRTQADTTYVDAKIIDSISDADTTHAPTGNAVFDALALKAPLASPTFTGAVLIGDGTATAPAMAFSSDNDGSGTGIYRSGANALSIATNGLLRFTIESNGDVTIADGKTIAVGTGSGTKFGGSTSQKLGFYGVTAIAQRNGAAQAAVVTTGSTSTTPFGYTTAAQADAIVTLVNELRSWAVAQGFIKGSA